MTMVSSLTIGQAQPSDARRLALFAARVFQETFAPHNTAENMRTYLDAAFSEARQRAEIEDSAAVTLLATSGENLHGYSHLRLTETPPCVPDAKAIELVRFYVDSALHGRGIAHGLMRESLRAAAARASAIWLGVWERNPRALAFYAKWGFRDVGSHDFMLGTDRQTDRILWRPTPE